LLAANLFTGAVASPIMRVLGRLQLANFNRDRRRVDVGEEDG